MKKGVAIKVTRRKSKKTRDEILAQRIKDTQCFESQPYRDCAQPFNKNRSKTQKQLSQVRVNQ